MGLDNATVRTLVAAKAIGCNFREMATIGRQSFFPDPSTLRTAFNELGFDGDPERFVKVGNGNAGPFYTLLGAYNITSIDISNYEGVTVLHDMNLPIPDSLKDRFSVVHDGGSLEHIFNVPQAFKNCMEMVADRGHFIQTTAANNLLGHGFYQFSPELMFRIFSPENGYRIICVLLHEVREGGKCYKITDPMMLGHRDEIVKELLHSQFYITTIAQRIGHKEIFQSYPQQSDYVTLWSGLPYQPDLGKGCEEISDAQFFKGQIT